MKWHKVIFSSDQIHREEHIALNGTVLTAYLEAGRPKNFATFSAYDADRYVYTTYFTPVAIGYCSDLVASLKGVPCELPLGVARLSWQTGDSGAWRLFSDEER
jgi:hypothetical protein